MSEFVGLSVWLVDKCSTAWCFYGMARRLGGMWCFEQLARAGLLTGPELLYRRDEIDVMNESHE